MKLKILWVWLQLFLIRNKFSGSYAKNLISNKIFAVFLIKVSAWLFNHAVCKIGLTSSLTLPMFNLLLRHMIFIVCDWRLQINKCIEHIERCFPNVLLRKPVENIRKSLSHSFCSFSFIPCTVQYRWSKYIRFISKSFTPRLIDNYSYFRCDATGLTQPTSFANCVDGRKVANYGTPYDFNSIMHYGVYV